jgi:pimeloyl-ACP methyl ester carboxylesterase
VPVDWHNPDSTRFKLALVKFKATQKVSKGALFVNPGGPGGSGIDFVKRVGDVISKMVDGHYDVIGFDPRGVGDSNTIRCFEDGIESKMFMANRPVGLGRGDNVANFAAVQEAFVNQCIRKNKDFLPYVSTASVARDLDALRDAFGEDVTNYIGFSYGTFIGAVYVNMFPDRVGRFMVDGCLDPSSYSGDNLKLVASSLRHTEDGVDALGSLCEAAGPEKCALARKSENSPSGDSYVANTIRQFVTNLVDKPLLATNQSVITVMTELDATGVLFSATYNTAAWPQVVANIDEAIRSGRGDAIVDAYMKRDKDLCPLIEPYLAAQSPIMCLDGHHDVYQNLTSWMQGIDEAVNVSPTAGLLMGSYMMRCLYWNVTASERYTGPWNRTTKNKVLIVGATGDPVTPVESAARLEELMEGNGVFHKHHGWGHCSLGQPSQCTLQVIKKYFVDGEIPQKGSSCPFEYNPFDPPTAFTEGDLSYEDIGRAAYAIAPF